MKNNIVPLVSITDHSVYITDGLGCVLLNRAQAKKIANAIKAVL